MDHLNNSSIKVVCLTFYVFRSCVRAGSDQTKDYKIDICFFSTKQAALREKS